MAFMASKEAALLLLISILFFSCVSSTLVPCPPVSTPKTPPTTSKQPTCPKNTVKWGACVDLLGGLVHLVEAAPPSSHCCSLLKGLTDVEAAVCLCMTIKANVLGAHLDVPVAFSLLVNACGKKIPPGYKCA